MKARSVLGLPCVALLLFAPPLRAAGLANRVFVSAKSGNDLNSCDNISTPCQTLAGAVVQLNANGEAIILDSGGYGAVTITQGVTIEAPAGVTAFIHPASGDAVTVNAGSSTVTLRGLVLNVGTGNGITATAVGTLNVEKCFITGFTVSGIAMNSDGRLSIKDTDVKGCNQGVKLASSDGIVRVTIDRSRFDANVAHGFLAQTTTGSLTTATNSTANNNGIYGWYCGGGSGLDVLNLEFCFGSGNGADGVYTNSTNASTAGFVSNCVFSNNTAYGVHVAGAGTVKTRGNNSMTGNGTAATLPPTLPTFTVW